MPLPNSISGPCTFKVIRDSRKTWRWPMSGSPDLRSRGIATLNTCGTRLQRALDLRTKVAGPATLTGGYFGIGSVVGAPTPGYTRLSSFFTLTRPGSVVHAIQATARYFNDGVGSNRPKSRPFILISPQRLQPLHFSQRLFRGQRFKVEIRQRRDCRVNLLTEQRQLRPGCRPGG